jgi:hypothetical protein
MASRSYSNNLFPSISLPSTSSARMPVRARPVRDSNPRLNQPPPDQPAEKDEQRLTRRQQMEVVLLLRLALSDDDGVASVVASGATRADVRLVGEDVDELAFALVTPLGAESEPRERQKERRRLDVRTRM